ncbi:MAG: GntR family transcriptional regulator [Anaerolineales bacterium]|nr:GntR family transcriptional regulator [Anaerolineales bacterium]
MSIRRSRPIVDQIDEILRQRIYDDVYPPGYRLPSESELLQEFGVSRATIRTALTRLATEGLILRKQGDGTYVNEHLHDVNAELGGLWEYVRLIHRSGYQAAIRLLQVEQRPATPAETDALALEMNQGQEVVFLKRLFLADGQPAILTANAIPRHLFQRELAQTDTSIPLPRLLQLYCQQHIAYAIFDIRAAIATADVAALLQRPPAEPLLKIVTTFYNARNEPLVHGTSYYDDQLLSLRLIQTWT